MAHTFKKSNVYFLQLPYLNSEGNAKVVEIGHHDAVNLAGYEGTHRVLHSDGKCYVVTPKVPAVIGHVFQEGEAAI